MDIQESMLDYGSNGNHHHTVFSCIESNILDYGSHDMSQLRSNEKVIYSPIGKQKLKHSQLPLVRGP